MCARGRAPEEAARGGGERAWPGSLRAVRRRPAIVRRRPDCAEGRAAGAEVGWGSCGGGGGGGRGTGLRFKGRSGPPSTRKRGSQGARRVRRGRQLRVLGKDLTDGHLGPVCLPPTEDRLLRGRETLTTENRVARKEKAGREAFPREWRRDVGKSQDGGGDRGAADTEPL